MLVEFQEIILIIEDNDVDFEITTRAFRKAKIANQIQRCEDGDLALDYLYHRGDYVDSNKFPTPSVILLDLNLPGIDGREVLQKIKIDEHLKRIPVIVLTTSNDKRDIEECYRLGANSYVQKPVQFERFLDAIIRLTDYWLGISILPPAE